MFPRFNLKMKAVMKFSLSLYASSVLNTLFVEIHHGEEDQQDFAGPFIHRLRKELVETSFQYD